MVLWCWWKGRSGCFRICHIHIHLGGVVIFTFCLLLFDLHITRAQDLQVLQMGISGFCDPPSIECLNFVEWRMNSLSIEHFTESFGSFPYSGADAPKGALPNFPPSLMGHVPRVKLPLWSRYLGHIGRLIRYAACPFCRSSPSRAGTSMDRLVLLNVFGVFLSSGENTM